MAYSDYGGYAYRNGVRVLERSDAVLSPEGIKSTPGQWPGWTLPEGRAGHSMHVLLGDGPIFVGLYKQSGLSVYRLGAPIPLPEIVTTPDAPIEEYDGVRYLDERPFKESERPCDFDVGGHRITVYWREDDNHYQYVCLVQPDGTQWHGWSGYGVGAGLEECGYGYSTEAREADLWHLFKRPALTSSEAS